MIQRMKALPILMLAALAGCTTGATLEFRPVMDCVSGQAKYPTVAPTVSPVCLAPDVIVNDADIISVTPVEHGRFPNLMVVTFSPAGQKRFSDFTFHHVGEKFAVIVNGVVAQTPTILEPISGNGGEIILTPATEDAVIKRFKGRAAP